jgi:hypothetical protein
MFPPRLIKNSIGDRKMQICAIDVLGTGLNDREFFLENQQLFAPP